MGEIMNINKVIAVVVIASAAAAITPGAVWAAPQRERAAHSQATTIAPADCHVEARFTCKVSDMKLQCGVELVLVCGIDGVHARAYRNTSRSDQ
jgi:hypothetical protein